MNLLRHPASLMGRHQPPLMRQYWLHRRLAELRSVDGPDRETEIPTTESGEANPDDQT